MIVEALEPQQLPLGAVHGADDLETHALIGMVPTSPSRALAVRCTTADVAILQGEADRDVHRPPPLTRSGARWGGQLEWPDWPTTGQGEGSTR